MSDTSMSGSFANHAAEAISLLKAGSAIAIVNDNGTVSSNERGIKFIFGLIDSGNEILSGACVADKVVGRAAAFLFALSGVKYVYAEVLSKPAEEVLSRYGIDYEYGTLVDGIINRAGDGPCPMESAVLNVDNANDAFIVLKNKLRHFVS